MMESGRLYFDPSACHANANMLFPAFRGGGRSMMSIEETSKRRPFFSSSDDLYDESYYDEQSPEKKRRLTPDQVHMLEKSFETENKLEPERKTQLAKKLGLQPRQVAVWFQNRRARWKTKQLERDYDVLKSSYDALLSNYDTLVKENDKLKSEVVSLTEKVEVKEEYKQVDELGVENMGNVSGGVLLMSNKIEDGSSSGSGVSSAVVDDHDGPQLVDSGDSYFPSDPEYPGCMAAVDQSEEDDGSDDGRSYFSNVLVAADDHQQEEPMGMGWWVWS
ncbi:hypothetical protein Ddye_000389 [Dipteronia dyeriana]|uniref:Homeobox-leucine zipper protein n=1 Tax=Dipteronia dyeriana TaxID=168575 RepID=A0AAD9XLT7_9ROSI|nr:hypothetical protein Ddye_000389 [Dipteronia dyeriana]